MSTSDELDESILAALYGAPPKEFVARRKAMAADLRAAGNRDRARAVLALRRPSLAEWALNRVAAEDSAAVAEFVTAADAVERAQTEAFRGGDTNVRDAVRRLRDASATLLGRAEQVIDAGAAATASHTAALTSLLADVAGSEPARRQLEGGHLGATDVSAADPFAAVQGEVSAPESRPKTSGRPTRTAATDAAPPVDIPSPAGAKERRRLERARDDARAAQRRASERLAVAEEKVATAAAAVADLDARLDTARAAHDDARAKRDDAARTAEAAADAVADAEAALDRHQ